MNLLNIPSEQTVIRIADALEEMNMNFGGTSSIGGCTREEYNLYVRHIDGINGELPRYEVNKKETWSLEDVKFSGESFHSEYTTSTRALDFNLEGTEMYVLGRTTNNVVAYTMDTAWDITTAAYKNEFSIYEQMGKGAQPLKVPHGLFFKKDGSRMYVWNRTELWEYSLRTPWDVSTSEYSDYIDLTSIVTRGHDIDFCPAGENLYVEDRGSSEVHQFTLSEAWNIATAKHVSTIDISAEDNEVRGIQLDGTGKKMFLLTTGSQLLHEYRLLRRWDLSTAVHAGSISMGGEGLDPRNVTWKHDGTGFYITQTAKNKVFRYDIIEEGLNNAQ